VTVSERSLSELDSLVAKVGKAIDRLNELRTVLISAAVIGKVDVRDRSRGEDPQP
jgi:hypothetical protein